MTEDALIRIVDDDDSVRVALQRLLRAAGFETRAYPSVEAFLLEPPSDRAGCLVLDVSLPGASGLDLQADLVARGIALPVVFLTGHATEAVRKQAMQAGAVDFIEKPVASQALFGAVQRAVALYRRLHSACNDDLRARVEQLTSRQALVLNRIVDGATSEHIAGELGLSLAEVESQCAQLMETFGAASKPDLRALIGRLRDSAPGAGGERRPDAS